MPAKKNKAKAQSSSGATKKLKTGAASAASTASESDGSSKDVKDHKKQAEPVGQVLTECVASTAEDGEEDEKSKGCSVVQEKDASGLVITTLRNSNGVVAKVLDIGATLYSLLVCCAALLHITFFPFHSVVFRCLIKTAKWRMWCWRTRSWLLTATRRPATRTSARPSAAL
jgi:hypothetical protein